MAVGRTETVARIEQALQEDERTASAVIEVIVENGLVTLKGTVASAEVKETAESIAKEQPGVLDVTNALDIDESEVGDQIIVAPPRTTTTKSAANPPYGQ